MKSSFLIAASIALLYFSCGPSSEKSQTVTDTVTLKSVDTLLITKDSIINQPLTYAIPAGFYQGMLPCKGCEGIQQTIYFDSDNRYKLEELNWGSKSPVRRQQGKWEKKADTILLYINNAVTSRFRFSRDSLYTFQREGKTIDAPEKSKYILIRKTSPDANTVWREKGEQGIDFYGVGNEPFWNVEIDNEKMILFKLADWNKPVIVPIENPKTYRDSIVYFIPDSTRLRITIFNEFCSDGMSDYLYEQKVHVRYKGQLYSGCGMHLGK